MAAGDIKLGLSGAEILLPHTGRSLTKRTVEISREERTVSGKLTSDLVAVKYIFSLEYEYLEGQDLENLINLYELHEPLNLIIVNRDSSEKNYMVKLRPFDYSRISILEDWLWGNVLIEVEEI